MTPAQQRYEIAQIFAECRAKGLPLQLACLASAHWFDCHGIAPPKRLLEWLDEVPADQWRPVTLH